MIYNCQNEGNIVEHQVWAEPTIRDHSEMQPPLTLIAINIQC